MAFWEGVVAGYGIAIPVGAIAILIIETGLRSGFRLGFTAGAGAATGDVLYATLAVVAGAALAVFLAPYATHLRLISGLVLVAVGAYGLSKLRGVNKVQVELTTKDNSNGHFRTYGQFLGITLLNPLTIAYFGALILGTSVGQTFSLMDRMAFVLGAGLASLSWQTLLAGSGSLARQYMSPRFQLYTSLIGNAIVVALGLRILLAILFS
jgi:threonine/homoserine/homoserine lactone efflux protein